MSRKKCKQKLFVIFDIKYFRLYTSDKQGGSNADVLTWAAKVYEVNFFQGFTISWNLHNLIDLLIRSLFNKFYRSK